MGCTIFELLCMEQILLSDIFTLKSCSIMPPFLNIECGAVKASNKF